MNKIKGLIKAVFAWLGVDARFIKVFGLRQSLLLHFMPRSLRETKFFWDSLPISCREFIEKVDLSPGDKVIDLGANVGDTVNFFNSKGCEVVAFEPNPVCADFLRKRFSGLPQIKIEAAAVSSESGWADFYVADESPLSSSLLDRSDHLKVTKVKCRVQSIGEVLRQHGPVKFIKIDVEGAEYEILKQLLAPENLKMFSYCAVETHHHRFPAMVDVHNEISRKIEESELKQKIFLGWH